jgi:hypothetical protein
MYTNPAQIREAAQAGSAGSRCERSSVAGVTSNPAYRVVCEQLRDCPLWRSMCWAARELFGWGEVFNSSERAIERLVRALIHGLTSSVGEHFGFAPTSAPKSAPKETLGRRLTRYRRSTRMCRDEERLTRFDLSSTGVDTGVNQDAVPSDLRIRVDLRKRGSGTARLDAV